MQRIPHDLSWLRRAHGAPPEPFELHDVLASAVRVTEGLPGYRASIHLESYAMPRIRGDANRLRQLFVNLLVNSAQAIERGVRSDEIHVDARVELDGRIVTVVRDAGPGVPAAFHDRIFDPFFTTKSFREGSGLGLCICDAIAAQHQGDLALDRTPTEGATFRVTLPSVASLPREAAAAPPAPRRGKILIVDDEPVLGRALHRVLRSQHDVVVTTSAKEALGHLGPGAAFDVVLCDAMMPGMTGVDFHAAAQSTNRALARRIVFMTAGMPTLGLEVALRALRNPVMLKPFDSDALRLLIAHYMRKGPGPGR
jgi:CheY-like chemotaxis protein